MKTTIFFLSLCIFSSLAAAQQVGIEACRLSDFEESRCEVAKRSDIKVGREICRAAENSQIVLREANYSMGKLDGSLTCRDFLGQTYLKAQYQNGQLQGEHADFSNNRSWRDVKSAWNVKYFENGKQVGVEFYAEEKGKVLDYLPNCYENGSTTSNFAVCVNLDYGSYKDQVKKHIDAEVKKRHAELNKVIEQKYSNGKIRFRAQLVDGRYEGELIKNFENGNPQEKTTYKNGDPLVRQEFFESGAKKSLTSYEKGKIKKEENFYENGKPSETVEYIYSNGPTRSNTKRYHQNGKIRSEETRTQEYGYYYGIRDGTARYYDTDGALIIEENFKNGRYEGLMTHITENQKIVTEWKNDKKVTETIYNLKTGNVVEKAEFHSDGSEKKRYRLLGDEI